MVVMLSNVSKADRSSSAEAAAFMTGVVSPLKESWNVPDIGDEALVVTRCCLGRRFIVRGSVGCGGKGCGQDRTRWIIPLGG